MTQSYTWRDQIGPIPPQISGKEGRTVKISPVLHILNLQNNLLSVLHLTQRSGFHVRISSDHMDFIKDSQTRLVASINEHNTAFLNGRAAGNTKTAQTVNPLSQNLTLWHCCFGHYPHAGVKTLAKHKLVTGLDLGPKKKNRIPGNMQTMSSGKNECKTIQTIKTLGLSPTRVNTLWCPLCLSHYIHQFQVLGHLLFLCHNTTKSQIWHIWSIQTLQGLCQKPPWLKNKNPKRWQGGEYM